MNVRRKYNLAQIGRTYESIDIEVTGEDIEDIIQRIENAWQIYRKSILEKKVN